MKELEKRIADESIEMPDGGTLREDVIVRHGIRIGWRDALKWASEIIKKNYLKEQKGVSERKQYVDTWQLDSLSDIAEELKS